MSIIQPLDVNKFIDNMGLKEITSPILLSAKGKFDVDGLFSEIIFGLNFSSERRKTYAYINLNTRIIHPFIYEVLNKIERKLIDLINGGTYYYDEANKLLSKDPAENLKEISGFDGAMYAILHGINYRGETDVRDKLVDRLIECVDNRLAFVDKFLVIPPDFRPIQLGPDGSLSSVDDINSTYIKLINYSKKIKLVDNNDANGVMSDSALIRKEIQNLVNDLYLLGKMRTGKKTGISRSSLLGKRVDFSARTVISGGFDLPVGTVGVPYRILASISQPFLVHYFTKVLVPETDNYNKLMEIFKKNKYDQNNNVMVVTNFLADIANDTIKLSPEEEQFIISTFQEVVNDKYVLMKRDPSFHKDSWQSFRVRVETGVTIGLNITQTTLFNADFDGDTMAIFMPLSLEAQEDCRKMCIPTGVTNVTQSSIEIKHELALCSFTITDDSKPKGPDLGIMSLKELSTNLDIGIQPDKHVWQTLTVRLYNGKSIKTTLGKAIFNAIFPADFLKDFYDGFINKQINKKVLNDDILQNLLKKYERETVGTIVDKIVHVLTRYSSIYPSSLVLSEFLEASMFNDLKEKYKKSKTMIEKQAIIEEIEKRIKNDIGKKMPMINNIVASGSRGNPNQIRQVMVTKGILQDPQGNFLSIDESYIDGLSPTSTFLGGFGSRKGIMDRSRSTAVTGYLYRKMIYALASVVLDKELVDCGTKKTIKCKITKDNAKLLYGRYIIDRAKVLLSKDNIEDYYGQYVDLRTPIYCKSLKLCKTCYGNLMGFYNSPYVGIIAAQSLGERGSQEIMKTFHTGGSTEVSIPDILQQAADNNPLTSRDILDKYFIQENTKLKFKDSHDVVIELYHSDYFNLGITEFTLDQEKSGIIVSNMNIPGTMIKSAISLKPFVAKISFKSGEKTLDEFEFIVDDKIFLPYELFEIEEYRNSETDKDKIIRLKGNTKNIPFFINIDLSSSDMNVLMQTILGIIEKKNIMKFPEIAFNKLTKIYGEKFNVAYNHIEILVSQIFRNAKRPEVPARLIEPYEAKVHGIKNIAHLESFLSGMLFENMSKSLLNGFINDSVIHNPLERLLSDDFDFE